MSLAKRLQAVIPERSNHGCVTCQWLEGMPDGDRVAWDDWIAQKHSLSQLWEIACSDPERPFPVSITGLRHHVRNHHKPL